MRHQVLGPTSVARQAANILRPGGTITLTCGFLARRTVAGTFVKTAMNAALEASAKALVALRVNGGSPG